MLHQEFRRIYDSYSRKLYNYALWTTRNEQASQDILQAVFLKLWKQRNIPSSAPELEAWLFTVTRNTCLDHFRAQKRRARLYTKAAEEEKTRPQSGGLDSHFAWDLLKTLSTDDRTIIYMHIKMGYNYKEIGRIMNLEENAVRVRAFRAFRRLRRTMSKEER